MGRVFFISDLHFFHANIIKYESRPFKDVEEMNQVLINNWNSIVKSNDDKVFILGDLSLGNKDQIKLIIDQLNGYKILIFGNHDRGHSINWFENVGINEVYKYPIIYKSVTECVLCGYTYSYKERRYTTKPKNPNKQYSYRQDACNTHF